MAQIASAAGMTAANLYVYFDSKLAILYEVYRSLARHSRRRRELRQCAHRSSRATARPSRAVARFSERNGSRGRQRPTRIGVGVEA
ncbi:TetR family transcriptional regulator [Paraburkholderia sp. 32]|uniref:TetR family transcriptional regulator n=1 Tax=Paraburkholderia sp. 32 TaxID=2991057 RepID=UPI003D25C788